MDEKKKQLARMKRWRAEQKEHIDIHGEQNPITIKGRAKKCDKPPTPYELLVEKAQQETAAMLYQSLCGEWLTEEGNLSTAAIEEFETLDAMQSAMYLRAKEQVDNNSRRNRRETIDIRTCQKGNTI